MHAASRFFAGALLLAAPAAFAQSSETINGVKATARVYAPFTMTQDGSAGLSFGDLLAPTSGGSVVLDPQADVRTPSLSVTLPATSTMSFHSAKFLVGGNTGATYAITLPTTPVTLTGSVSGTMTADTFKASVTNGSGALQGSTTTPTGTLSATSANNFFRVGATLNVNAAQAAGDYTGTFAITAAYN